MEILAPPFARAEVWSFPSAALTAAAHLDTPFAPNGAATSALLSQALFQGDEDIAAPILFSNGGSVGMSPDNGRTRFSPTQLAETLLVSLKLT